jgi:hypothetical protein
LDEPTPLPCKTDVLHIEGFSKDLLKRCKQRALAKDLTLKQFVIQTLENAVAEVIDSQEMKTDKGQFDSVLSQMLRTPPKKESEIKVGKKKAEAKRPKPSRQQSDR